METSAVAYRGTAFGLETLQLFFVLEVLLALLERIGD